MKSSKTLELFKNKGFISSCKYIFLKQFSKFAAPICYTLNIPLPHKYLFLIITYHTTGHSALFLFLKLLNVSVNETWQGNMQTRYKQNFRALLTNPISALALCETNFKGFFKAPFLINAKCPALILVRDPISSLKSVVNFIAPNNDKTINMGGGGKIILLLS